MPEHTTDAGTPAADSDAAAAAETIERFAKPIGLSVLKVY